MKYEKRMELEAQSIKAYGTKTRYKKILDKGIRMEVTDDETGRKYEGYQRFDLDSIETLMEEEIQEKLNKAAEALEKEKANGQPESGNSNT